MSELMQMFSYGFVSGAAITAIIVIVLGGK